MSDSNAVALAADADMASLSGGEGGKKKKKSKTKKFDSADFAPKAFE
jgi:hypothetical protein